MSKRRWLKPMSERVRDAKEVLDFAGQTTASKGGDARSAEYEKRNAKVVAAYDACISSGIPPAKAKPKVEKEFDISRQVLNRILRKKK